MTAVDGATLYSRPQFHICPFTEVLYGKHGPETEGHSELKYRQSVP